MIQNGMYYMTDSFKELVRSLGGEWNDQKKRPIVFLLQSTENPDLYWAIPVGKVNHRDEKALDRINTYMNYKDIRGCYYHIGRTTNKSIFFISDVIPITDKYILEKHLGSDEQHYILKNHKLISALETKLKRILSWENANPNSFRQHITDVKKFLLDEIKTEKEELSQTDKEQEN